MQPNKERIVSNYNRVRVAHARLPVLIGLFVICFAVISFRLFNVTVIDSDIYNRSAGTQKEENRRADIVDRNGLLLAINLDTASLYVNPYLILDPQEAAEKLSKILPSLSKDKLNKQFSSDKKFIWIKRNLTPKEHYAVNELGIPGLYFEKAQRRIYPKGNLTSHILGYTGVDGGGLAGVEKQFDERLLSQSDEPFQLSIDIRVQSILHQEISNAIDIFSAKAGAGVVMNVNNGEVYGMVSLPDFDPHNPGEAGYDQLFNRATLGVYEMGSTFKTLTMAMALDSDTVSLQKRYDVSKPLRINRFTIRDYKPKKGKLSVAEIYMHSSNIGTAKIIMDIGTDIQRYYFEELGIVFPLQLEIPEKAKPLLPSYWGQLTSITMSYGHGIAVTPIHISQAIAALVNGGVMKHATFIKGNTANSGVRVISEKSSRDVRRLMRLVVDKGTGRKSEVPGYFVGGKTGTAEKPSSSGGYDDKLLLSSFVGAFPMQNPEYIIFVVLDEPHGIKETYGYATGGWVAAPVVSNVIRQIGPLLSVPLHDKDDPQVNAELFVDYEGVGRGLVSF